MSPSWARVTPQGRRARARANFPLLATGGWGGHQDGLRLTRSQAPPRNRERWAPKWRRRHRSDRRVRHRDGEMSQVGCTGTYQRGRARCWQRLLEWLLRGFRAEGLAASVAGPTHRLPAPAACSEPRWCGVPRVSRSGTIPVSDGVRTGLSPSSLQGGEIQRTAQMQPARGWVGDAPHTWRGYRPSRALPEGAWRLRGLR